MAWDHVRNIGASVRASHHFPRFLNSMRLGLPRTHDSWLSKALSLGFNVPVDSAAEALVRLFPGASMKVGLLRGVLFGGILPGVGIYSPGAGDEVRCFQFIIREGFDAVPFLRFKPGRGAVKFLFFKGCGFKSLFFDLRRVAAVPEPSKELRFWDTILVFPSLSVCWPKPPANFASKASISSASVFSESGRCRG